VAGGYIAPDGRPSQAKGIGKTAKRHDLEKPKTPGIGGPATGPTDLQQGDVQRLEQAQRVAPITQQGPARPPTGGAQTQQPPTRAQVPADAIDYLGGRLKKGTLPAMGGGQGIERVDISQWMPLLKELARNPQRSGPLAAALVSQLSNFASSPAVGRVRVVDEPAIEKAVRTAYS